METLEDEITKNVGERLNRVVVSFNNYFNQMKMSLFQDIYDKLPRLLIKENLTAYDCLEIYDQIQVFRYRNEFLRDVVVLINSFNYVITSKGTFEKNLFFTDFNYNPYYTQDFWMQEMEKTFSFNFYPVAEFIEFSIGGGSKTELLMPIVIKKSGHSNYVVVLLVDLKKMLQSVDPNFTENFFILKEDKLLLYPSNPDIDMSSINNINIEKNSKKEFIITNEGYLYFRFISENGLIYVSLYPDATIKEQLKKINSFMGSLIFITFIFSFAISLYIARKVNNPVKRLIKVIENSKCQYDKTESSDDIRYITENVQKIMATNSEYVKDLNIKNSILNNFLYQAKLKGIYFQIYEIMDELIDKTNYAIICFELQYKKIFYEQMFELLDKATFLIKELISLYISERFSNSITFQVESNQIISIVNIEKEVESVEPIVLEVFNKLKSEEEYLLFTIAFSPIYSDISELNKGYDRVIETTKYRRLIEESQILSESSLKTNNNRYYFSMEQRDKFINSLKNKKLDECIKQLNAILHYNLKKDVRKFYIFLLLTEIINCCAEVLLQIYYDIPAEINIDNFYSNLNKCSFLEDYKELGISIISGTIAYMNNNIINEEDYIITYVKKYIKDHYAEDIYLDLLANNLNITSSYLSYYFKNKTGVNLSDYLNGYRVRKAVMLLNDTSLKVKDIAEQVGIPNTNTFTRLFKSYVGKTPNDYRKSCL